MLRVGLAVAVKMELWGLKKVASNVNLAIIAFSERFGVPATEVVIRNSGGWGPSLGPYPLQAASHFVTINKNAAN